MQRELKFRVWDTKSKKFIEFIPPREYMLDEDEWSHHDINDESSLTYPNNIQQTFDDRLIWQQFTGLLDKNNKEIYEGDITKDLDDEIGVVEFIHGSFIIKEKNIIIPCYSSLVLNNAVQPRLINPATFEIIGNIFENSELLENK